MATMVCPGLQPYLDSQLVESRIHRLRFPSPSPSPSNSYKTDTTVEQGGWSSIETLNNSKVSEGLKERSYGPTSVRLSPKSLELCTENLGNETGTHMIEIDLLPCSNFGIRDREGQNRKPRTQAKEFPPPLTTIRGSESLRVRSHREGGRLVLQLTKVSSSFQAHRSHGRLRLCLFTHPQDQHHLDTHQTNPQTLDVHEQQQDLLHAENQDKCEAGWEDTKACNNNNNNSNNSWSIETPKTRRRRRRNSSCKEDDHENNNELLIKNWGEPLWVATS